MELKEKVPALAWRVFFLPKKKEEIEKGHIGGS